MTLRIIVSKEPEKAFHQALASPPKSSEEAIKLTIGSVDFKNEDVKRIVQWSLTAERPFTIHEITDLLRIDIRRKTLTSRESEIAKTIETLSKTILTTANGTLRFLHSTIRDELKNITGHDKTLSSLPVCQGELTIRLLAYISVCLDASSEPSFDVLDTATINELFGSHMLLE